MIYSLSQDDINSGLVISLISGDDIILINGDMKDSEPSCVLLA